MDKIKYQYKADGTPDYAAMLEDLMGKEWCEEFERGLEENCPTPYDEPEMIACPFCKDEHPDDVLCGCAGEKAEAMRIWDKVDRGRRLTKEEDGFLCLWECL